ncbi:hypothetical protein G6011_02121 [Alternaria panax]|uniref:SprT-like domain-containing protein n=1 Tax=Alternaria panax TaxID=48097 RepID=A0AAD4FE14_9PLEO|nr:hypothetical protein G6011_02121 [Alternaria panax]
MCRKIPFTYKSVDARKPKLPPGTPEEFIDMIRDHHKRNPEDRIHSTKQGTCVNSCGKTIQPRYRQRIPLRLESHHTLRLCDEVKRSTEAGADGFSLEQQKAYEAFQALVEDKSDKALLKRLGKDNASKVSKDEMKQLIKTFSTIFFPTTRSDAPMELDFEWEDWRDRRTRIGLYYERDGGTPTISMCAFNYNKKVSSYGSVNVLAMDRLSTILHEIVHAYLDHYACRCVGKPELFEEDVNQLNGHGRAWQRIASLVERAAPEFTGLPMTLARFEAIKCQWDTLSYWPTQQEANDWKLLGYETYA